MHFFEYDSPIGTMIGKTIDIFLLSILWFVCCLPIITIGASTTALYYATVKCLRKGRGYTFKNFFHAFSQNLFPSTILLLFYGVLTIFLYICFVFAAVVEDSAFQFFLTTVYMFMGFVFLSMSCYSFPVLSRCSMKCGQIIRFSFGLMIRHFPFTLIMVLIVAAVAVGIWCVPLFAFCLPAVGSLLFSFFMERILIRYTPEEEKKGWYAERDGN